MVFMECEWAHLDTNARVMSTLLCNRDTDGNTSSNGLLLIILLSILGRYFLPGFLIGASVEYSLHTMGVPSEAVDAKVKFIISEEVMVPPAPAVCEGA